MRFGDSRLSRADLAQCRVEGPLNGFTMAVFGSPAAAPIPLSAYQQRDHLDRRQHDPGARHGARITLR